MEGSIGRCRHVHNNTAEPLAFGLCQECYKSYVRASGGNVRGAEDPPAYKRNLRKCASSLIPLVWGQRTSVMKYLMGFYMS